MQYIDDTAALLVSFHCCTFHRCVAAVTLYHCLQKPIPQHSVFNSQWICMVSWSNLNISAALS